jgi:Ser/Thr protein kinase RdoA (MazF antagonist)
MELNIMEPEITARYNDRILHEAMRRYGIAEDRIRLLDGFESYIYEFERDGAEYILRIGHNRRRSVELIQGEIDWINYLAAGGAGVSRAILSQNGELVECIDDDKGGQFLVTAFVKAQGRPVWEIGWTTELYERYGELLGRIHVLSRTYTPRYPAWRRGEWDDPNNLNVEQWLPPSEVVAAQKFRQIKAHLDTLPRSAESYGLIHQDAHGGNFFVDETGRFTLFDFDDCVYGWYIYDVAMVVMYMTVNAQDPLSVTQEFMPPFWRGYQREMPLDPIWLVEIPHFMKLREVDLYAMLYRSFGDLQTAADDSPWIERFLKDRKSRIENDISIVEYDFAALGQHV